MSLYLTIRPNIKKWLRKLQALIYLSGPFKKHPLKLETRLGPVGEWEAVKYLKRKSFTIWDRNWRCPYGELDIVASSGRTLVFIEVKTRWLRNDHLFEPFEAINRSKQNRLRQLSRWFISNNKHRIRKARIKAFRFDAIAVYKEKDRWRIIHEEGAFQ